MKYKLINNKTQESNLCDRITIDGFDYFVSNEVIKDVRPYKGKWQVEKGSILNKFPTYLTDLSECKLVIATNNPDIDIPKVVDEVERLALNEFPSKTTDQWNDYWSIHERKGFIKGYNKSQETHPFSEEDMIEFADWVYRSQFGPEGYTQDRETKELLQIWQEQKPKTIYYE